jgi:hypothetical protein
MALRQIANSVLRRLREDSISSDWSGSYIDTTSLDDYQKLIIDFVNEVKREVEDAWDWSSLRRTQTVTTANGTSNYTITGASQRMRLLSVIEQSNGVYLTEVSDTWIKRAQQPASSISSGRPSHYSINGISSGELTVDLWSQPDAVYQVDFNMVDPQEDLVNATDTLTVLENIVILGAWSRAIAERGEDGGSMVSTAQESYSGALKDAIAQDMSRNTNDWVTI